MVRVVGRFEKATVQEVGIPLSIYQASERRFTYTSK